MAIFGISPFGSMGALIGYAGKIARDPQLSALADRARVSDTDSEDNDATLLIVALLLMMGVLSCNPLFGGYLLLPTDNWLPHHHEILRLMYYGVLVSVTMLTLSVGSILMSGIAPAVSLVVSALVAVAASQLLGALGHIDGLEFFRGLPALTIAAICFAWFYFEKQPRRWLPLTAGLVIILIMFLTGSTGFLRFLWLAWLSLFVEFNMRFLVALSVLPALWFGFIATAGAGIREYSITASPDVDPMKVAAIIAGTTSILLWWAWLEFLLFHLSRKRDNN